MRIREFQSGLQSRRATCCALVLSLACLAGFPATALAQEDYPDLVTLQPSGSTGKRIIRCRIIEYDGVRISVATPDAAAFTSYPAGEVTRITTPQSEGHLGGIAALAVGDFAAAKRSLAQGLKQEQREWVRREILALDVQAHLATGDYIGAAQRFQGIVAGDPQSRHYRLIPLVWSPQLVQESQIQPAYELLTHGNVYLRFTAASVLLEEPSFGALAQAEMGKLKRSTDPRVAYLAAAQLWRLSIAQRDVSAFGIERWRKEIEGLPAELRGGPYFLLGRGLQLKLLREDAALTLLRVPILFDHDRELAALASLEAATALQQHGRVVDAEILFRELLTRFDGTSAAKQARVLREQATGP